MKVVEPSLNNNKSSPKEIIDEAINQRLQLENSNRVDQEKV